jgi:hypothetical protein
MNRLVSHQPLDGTDYLDTLKAQAAMIPIRQRAYCTQKTKEPQPENERLVQPILCITLGIVASGRLA